MPRLMECNHCGRDGYHLYVNEKGEVEWVVCAKEFGGCGYKLSNAELDTFRGTFDISTLKRLDYDALDMVGG